MLLISAFRKISDLLDSNEKKQLHINIFYQILIMLLELTGIALIIPIFNNFNQDNNYLNFLDFDHNTKIFLILILFAFFFLSKTLIISYLSYKRISYTYFTQQSLQNRVVNNYLNLSYKEFLNSNSSRILQRITGEVVLFIGYVLQSTLLLISELLVLIGILTFLLIYDFYSTTIILTSFGSFLLFYYLYQDKKIIELSVLRPKYEEQRTEILKTLLDGQKLVKLLGKEQFYNENFNLYCKKLADIGSKISLIILLPRLWIEFIAICSIMILFFINNDNATINLLEKFTIFLFASLRVMPSINRISTSYQELKFGFSSLENINKSINKKYKKVLVNNKRFNFSKKIEFKNIVFKYDIDSSYILKNFNLKINKGECIGLMGTSGIGKSTFFDIFMMLLDPTEGEILIDGKKLRTKIEKRSWQNIVGYIPQNTYIENSTLANNIAFGIQKNKINFNKIHEVIQIANLENFVKNLKQGLETILGEHGSKISGGQKQRIGIARALYNDPEIILFDEATSSLDKKNEEIIITSLNKIKKKKTVIFISHNQDTLKICEKIYKFENKNLIRIK